MHFKPLHEIKWRELLLTECNHAPERVFLIITQVLLNELSPVKEDKSHYHSTRKRVKEFLKLLDKVPADQPAENTTWLDSDKIGDNLFLRCLCDEDRLTDRGDDKIVESIRSYKDEISEGDSKENNRIFLATDDKRLRARIKFSTWLVPVDVPDEFRFESEQDPLEKENRKLRKKLEEVKEPRLSIAFKKDSANRVFYRLNPYIGDVLPPERIIEKHPLIKESPTHRISPQEVL